MYLSSIFCENMGPMERVAIKAGFEINGNPKPIVVVGKNGSGKSILLSNIVDALHELGDKAFQDVTEKQAGGGHKYFKLSSARQIKIDKKYLLGYTSFFCDDGKKLEYAYGRGTDCQANMKKAFVDVDFDAPIITLKDDDKTVTNDTEAIKDAFSKSVLCCFPSYRYVIPNWIVPEYARERVSDPYRRIYSNNLNRSLIVDNARNETPLWIEDVLIDSKADLILDVNGLRVTSDVNNTLALGRAKANVETILSAILEQSVELKLGYRNGRESRLAICRKATSSPVTPSFDALSTGQTILIEMFTTILRYADAIDINQSINLENIKGVVVIDEIDSHLHVDLLHDVLPKVMRLFPRVQFVITAHSPMFILGLERFYGRDGFDLYELPTGRRIDAEEYVEFKSALKRMKETRTARQMLEKKVQEATEFIKQSSMATDDIVVLTEGYTDWKHMERAWNKLKDSYLELDGKIHFYHYHPKGKGAGEPEFEMGDASLVEMCHQFAKIKQPQKFVFVSDADNPKKTHDLMELGRAYKSWGNNVFSFQLPDPCVRPGFSEVCIEHYYTDDELKTWVEIDGVKRRLFLSGEFKRNMGQTSDHVYFYQMHLNLKADKPYSIIEDCVNKLDDVADQPVNYALPKNDFATELLKDNPALAHIGVGPFRKIFDILLQIKREPFV